MPVTAAAKSRFVVEYPLGQQAGHFGKRELDGPSPRLNLAGIDDAIFGDVPKETTTFVRLPHRQPYFAWGGTTRWTDSSRCSRNPCRSRPYSRAQDPALARLDVRCRTEKYAVIA
ncbi:MAG TPA: hypothetical protein VHB01_13075 [Nitrosospira sp.]|nr:hypothetical protein [Nitrosospira sp.]